MSTLNTGLAKLRRSNNLKQSQVASELGLSTSAYAKIERGERTLHPDYYPKLADLYNITVDELNTISCNRTTLEKAELSLFNIPEPLHICYSKFENTKIIEDYKELFDGFDNIRIITFSSSSSFIAKVLKECSFKDVEIIFGNKKVFDSMQYMKELVMDSDAIINVLVGDEPKHVEYLRERIANGTLRINIANPNYLSHEKVYILWNTNNNDTRVIMGSANMSLRAYSGKQKETINLYENDDMAFDYFTRRYDEFLKYTVCKIEPQHLKKLTAKNLIEDCPIIKTVVENNSTIYIDTNVENDNDDFDGYYETSKENIKTQLERYERYLKQANVDFFSPNKNNKIVSQLTPENCRMVIDTHKASMQESPQQGMEHPEFKVEQDLKPYFNNEPFDLDYTNDNVINDIKIFKEFFAGYKSGKFVGKLENSVDLASEKYYASVIFGFVSPFLHYCVKLSGNGIDSYAFPTYLILRGPKSAGKTPFCSFLLRLMFNQYKLNFDEMGNLIRKSEDMPPQTSLVPAMLRGQGFPVIIDELTRSRAKDYESTVKSPNNFKKLCSCVIFTCNDDFELSDYIVKRSVLFNFDISLNNNGQDIQMVNSTISNLQNITGDLYKCFYERFAGKFASLLEELNTIRHSNNNKGKLIPDVFKLGSETLMEIIEEYSGIDDSCSYVQIYDSSFYRNGQSNLEERKKQFIDDFEFGEWALDIPHNLLFKVYEGMDGKTRAKEFAEAMNQYGYIDSIGNKVRIKLDWAKDFFQYDFQENSNNMVASERVIERIVEKPVEVIKEVEVEKEKPKGLFNKVAWLLSDN